MTMLDTRRVTGGVDTHLDVHVAAALDPLGGLLGTKSFEVNPAGYKSLLSWLESFGAVGKVGVEGTGSYGAGLARFLHRTASMSSRSTGRTEPNGVGRASPIPSMQWKPRDQRSMAEQRVSPRRKDGAVEAIRVLLVAKRSARQARVKAVVQVRHLVVTAPDVLHRRLKGLTVSALVKEGAKLRPAQSSDPVTAATKAAVSSLARRIQALERELTDLDTKINSLLAVTAPELLALFGVGPDTAATLLVTAGDNPERLHSEAAFAHLCGVSPIPASSGKSTGRFRLDSGGDRQANSALWRIVMVRIAHDPETTAYFERHMKEGRTKPEVIRILKRYVAREVYRHLPRG